MPVLDNSLAKAVLGLRPNKSLSLGPEPAVCQDLIVEREVQQISPKLGQPK